MVVPRLQTALLLLLPFAPFAVLASQGFRSGAGSASSSTLEAFTAASSLEGCVAAAGAAALALLFGLGPALIIAHRRRGALGLCLLALAIAPLALPQVTTAGCWSDLFGLGPAPLPDPGHRLLAWCGLAFAWAVGLFPLAALGLAFALLIVPRDEELVARLQLPFGRRLRAQLLPRLLPPAFATFLAVFTLAAHDGLTPPHFGVNPLSARLLDLYRTTLEVPRLSGALLLQWALLALPFVLALRALRRRDATPRLRPGPPPRAALVATALGATLALIVPIVHAAAQDPVLSRHLLEVGETLRSCGIQGFCALLIALLFIAFLQAPRSLRLPVLLLWLLPPLALGTGVQLLVAASPPRWEEDLFQLGLLYAALPWILLVLWLLPRSRARASAARLGAPWRTLLVPTLRERGLPALSLAAFASIAAVLREASLYSLAAPPGRESLAARSAHLLHFGFGSEVAGLQLVQSGLALFWALLAIGGLQLLSRRTGISQPQSMSTTRHDPERLELKSLRCRRGAFTLGALDLEIGPGEILAVLGPSGAGKTTLLEVLAGTQKADEGSLVIPPPSRRVAPLIGGSGLFPNANARRNLALLGEGIDPDAELDAVDFTADRTLPSQSLSSGEARRVALARVMASRRELWLLDEPGAHLDQKSWNAIAGRLAHRAREHSRRVIVTGHQLDDLLALEPDRLLLLDNGRVLACERTRELFDDPGSEAVARRLGWELFLDAEVRDGRVHSALGPHPEMEPPANHGRRLRIGWRVGEIEACSDGAATKGRVLAPRLTSRGPGVLVELPSKEAIVVAGNARTDTTIGLQWRGGVLLSED